MIPFSDEDLKEATIYNLEQVDAIIKQDGGWVKLIDVVGGVVFVQLQGACVGCASSNSTIQNVVQRHLRTHIHPEIIVKNVPYGMESELSKL
ncbi:MAG: hypothetical protein CSA19_00020 [Deltaproteobacteria bacterium]|nr:MAG: hypothetical protein CSA19_00020 [Deltaproteobacteria bacterium]